MTSIILKKSHQDQKTMKPVQLPRSVKITCGAPKDGRLPIIVTVVPVADLDAKGGVFVDFRLAPKDRNVVPLGTAASSLSEGDAAIEAMAAREAAVEAPAGAADETPRATDQEPKRAIVSHQVAQPLKLTVGQAETFRADVTMPAPAPEGEAWFTRGRFATRGGKDLISGWHRV